MHGLLLGLDIDGTLEVSNSFPLPHHSNDEDDKQAKNSGACSGGLVPLREELMTDPGQDATRPPCCGR